MFADKGCTDRQLCARDALVAAMRAEIPDDDIQRLWSSVWHSFPPSRFINSPHDDQMTIEHLHATAPRAVERWLTARNVCAPWLVERLTTAVLAFDPDVLSREGFILWTDAECNAQHEGTLALMAATARLQVHPDPKVRSQSPLLPLKFDPTIETKQEFRSRVAAHCKASAEATRAEGFADAHASPDMSRHASWLVRHRAGQSLASYKSRVCEVDAWTALYGALRRSQLTGEHVRKARATWTADKYTPKTINRVQTLRHLFHILDGRRALDSW